MKRPQYFAAKPIEEEYIPIENEIVLWRSVLDQAMQPTLVEIKST